MRPITANSHKNTSTRLSVDTRAIGKQGAGSTKTDEKKPHKAHRHSAAAAVSFFHSFILWCTLCNCARRGKLFQ